MKRWAQTVQATVQMASELVAREWRGAEEWQAGSAVPRPLFGHVAGWMEAFAGQPVVSAFLQQREQQRMLAKQVRDELFVLLAELEPQQAMAVLCRLPSSGALGYSQQHLALFAVLADWQVQEWEQEAYRRLQELVSPRTPFLQFLAGQVVGEDAGLAAGPGVEEEFLLQEAQQAVGKGEGLAEEPGASEELLLQEAKRITGEGVGLAVEPSAEYEPLLQEARRNPRFDLRLYVQPMEELAIRRRVHQAEGDLERVAHFYGVVGKDLPFVVRLVMERMKLEMADGGEEMAHVDDGSA